MTDLSYLKADFPILDDGVHFLDSGASSQKPIQVLEAMDRFARTSYANVHRGAYKLSVAATEAYEAARKRVAEFLGAPDENEVIFTRGATTSLNMVAFGWGLENLQPGDRIITTVLEHHANLVPWQMVAKRTGAVLDHIPIDDEGRLDMAAYREKLTDRVKVVAVTGMSNALGTISMRPSRTACIGAWASFSASTYHWSVSHGSMTTPPRSPNGVVRRRRQRVRR